MKNTLNRIENFFGDGRNWLKVHQNKEKYHARLLNDHTRHLNDEVGRGEPKSGVGSNSCSVWPAPVL